MPFQHPEGIGHGHVIERYAARKDSGHARYLVLKSGRFLRPEWPHSERFARDLIEDAATITDAEFDHPGRTEQLAPRGIGQVDLAHG